MASARIVPAREEQPGPDDFHPIIYAAIMPTSCLLFGVSLFMFFVRDSSAQAISDFDIAVPIFTEWMLAWSSSSILLFLPPVILSLMMGWYAHRTSTARALCIVVGCMTLGVGSAIAFYVAMILPPLTLLKTLSG